MSDMQMTTNDYKETERQMKAHKRQDGREVPWLYWRNCLVGSVSGLYVSFIQMNYHSGT